MATKEEIRTEIRSLDPNNAVLRDQRARHVELTNALKKVKRDRAVANADAALPCLLRYRLEEDERYSWRLYDADGAAVTELAHGMDLPTKRSIHPGVDGSSLRVESIEGSLEITAGDLHVREEFDPRRVYATQSGSSVTFKRTRGNLVVLWSYKHGNEIAMGEASKFTRLDRVASPAAKFKRRKTQAIVSAWVISQRPDITSLELTEELAAAFPENAVGRRHGQHYLSLSRHGRLPEPPVEDPREW
jgi:hypothetical protein